MITVSALTPLSKTFLTVDIQSSPRYHEPQD